MCGIIGINSNKGALKCEEVKNKRENQNRNET